MATATASFAIRFPDWFDERVEYEMTDKGYFAGPFVDFDDGTKYELYFYDPVRLAQDLEIMLPHGRPCLAKPNVIVVPEVTTAAIRTAIEYLAGKDYFRNLKPLDPAA